MIQTVRMPIKHDFEEYMLSCWTSQSTAEPNILFQNLIQLRYSPSYLYVRYI